MYPFFQQFRLTPLIPRDPSGSETYPQHCYTLPSDQLLVATCSLVDSLQVYLTRRMKLTVIIILGTVYEMYLNCSPFPHDPKRNGIYAMGQQVSQSEVWAPGLPAPLSPPPNLVLITSTLLNSISSHVKC